MRHPLRLATILLAVLLAVGMATAPATATPHTPITLTEASPRYFHAQVWSPAMRRTIPVDIVTPANSTPGQGTPRGVLYLLNGAGGGEDDASWQANTDALSLALRSNVYVVIPMQGKFTYYTDWLRTDPRYGVNKWSTFLGDELPTIIDKTFATNGRNAIAGISTSATAVLNLAIAHKNRYAAVAAYSGCASTTSPLGQAYVRAVVEDRGHTDARNMWGPYGGPLWRANDPLLHAGGLRGLTIYLSAASGLPGPYDSPAQFRDPESYIDRLTVGGALEAAARNCTVDLANRLRALRIPATVNLPALGTHSWRYWQDQLHRSWPLLTSAINPR